MEERRSAIVAATLPLFLEQGDGGHHPRDRPGRGHRRGHHLPGLRRQDRAARRSHRGRARHRAHRRRDRRDRRRARRSKTDSSPRSRSCVNACSTCSMCSAPRRATRRASRPGAAPTCPRSPRSSQRRPSASRARRPTRRASSAASRSRASTRRSAPTRRSRRRRSSRCCSTASAPRRRGGCAVLIRLVRDYLRPYRQWLDPRPRVPDAAGDGHADPADAQRRHHRQRRADKGDTSYIWKVGAIMLAVTFVQVVFAIVATFYGARSAMGFGRDVRRDLFHTVMELLGPRGRPVRRTVADHPHHQRRDPGAGLRVDDAARCSSPRRS